MNGMQEVHNISPHRGPSSSIETRPKAIWPRHTAPIHCMNRLQLFRFSEWSFKSVTRLMMTLVEGREVKAEGAGSRCTENMLEVICQSRHLPLMRCKLYPIHLHQLDRIAPQTLGGVIMKELGVGVAFPKSLPLSTLLPVHSLHLDRLSKLFLAHVPDRRLLDRQVTSFLQKVE